MTTPVEMSHLWTSFNLFYSLMNIMLKKSQVSLNFCYCLKKRNKLAINNQVDRCLWELVALFESFSGLLWEFLTFCLGELGWFSAFGFLSCHSMEESIRRLPLSWNWSQSYCPYCTNLSFCSLGWVTSYLSIVNF